MYMSRHPCIPPTTPVLYHELCQWIFIGLIHWKSQKKAVKSNLGKFLRKCQHVTPAGTGIMVWPGNDARDSLFLPPDALPGVSYRKTEFPVTSPGSSIHKLWISWFPVENKKVFCLITNINLPLMIIGNIFSVQLYVTTQLRTFIKQRKNIATDWLQTLIFPLIWF